jgi:AcrR family transcriptional regulator
MKQTPLQAPFEPVEVQPVPANRRVLSKQRTRQKVLESARGHFTERGYEASTIRDIAKNAGLSTGAVFANFADKADLFEAVLLEDHDAVVQRMVAAAGAEAPVADKLLAVFSAGYEHHLGNLPLLGASVAQSWTWSPAQEARGRNRTKVLIGLIGDLLRDACRKGELAAEFDIRLISEMLWDSYLANYRRAMFEDGGLEALRTRLADQIGVILAGLRKA